MFSCVDGMFLGNGRVCETDEWLPWSCA